MPSFIIPPFEKRFVLAALIVVCLAWMFWTGSRYPALDEKAMMSGAIQLEDSLSFEAAFPITESMGIPERVFWSTLNWLNTNRKGMTFGVLFAAAFLTAAAYLRRRSFRGGFANSALGLVIGTPLGVCVNCAAPIAKGMYSAGLRAETTLSAMIASPTLNIVVLTMVFSILPVYMAVAKIALSLLVILVMVPLICRALPVREIAPAPLQARPGTAPGTASGPLPGVPPLAPQAWSPEELGAAPGRSESLGVALREVILSYARNLWYIVKLTVPLMLLAGFLGALVATLLPSGLILDLRFSIPALLLIALVGMFLPVPIAFDVVMTGALLGLGLSHGYVMALLFTLGSFSVYSFFIVAGSVGLRAAWMLALCVAGLGALAGWGAERYHHWQSDRALEMLLQGDAAPARPGWGAAMAAGADPWTVADRDATATLTATPLAPPAGVSEQPFTRMEAATLGIDKPLEFSFRDMWPPFWEGRSLASGDIDNDGALDLVIASSEVGLYLYTGDGAGRFARQAIDLGALAQVPIFNAMLIDLDNDGWRDLVLASYRQGMHILRNDAGRFGPPEPLGDGAEGPGRILAMALSAGDPDRDGDLDLAAGYWAAGWYRRVPGEESRNAVLWNDGGQFATSTPLPGIPGETLSILFSDIDLDGAADLLVGNDFEVPDYVYMGDGAGGLAAITHDAARIPHTTTTTMAIKTADLLNDGTPELYFAQIAGRSSGVSGTLKMQPLERYCDGIADAAARALCQTNMTIKTWYRSGNSFDPTYAGKCQALTGRYHDECRAMLVKDLAIQREDPKICDLIPVGQDVARSFCELHFLPPRPIAQAEADAAIPQILRANVLLERAGTDTAYVDVAEARGLHVGGWSWDTKVADFDLDGWQDVYIVNGTWVPNEVSPSNLFFHNRGDGTFAEASGRFGLEDYLMTAAATAFDMDGDGDLDMVTHPVNGPIVAFRNNSVGRRGNALVVTLEDRIGNRDGIGARLTLSDASGRVQSREIQLGGGFMSFDAPQVHFGLGSETAATGLRIDWADGGVTEVTGPLPTGHHYRLRRE